MRQASPAAYRNGCFPCQTSNTKPVARTICCVSGLAASAIRWKRSISRCWIVTRCQSAIMALLSLLLITGALKLFQASCGTKCLRMSGATLINKTLPRTSPLRGRSAVLRIEPLRVSPLRAAVTDASGLRPPRSAWQPISWPCGAVSPVTGRVAPGNSQYGAATRRRAAVPARRRAAPTAHPRGGRAAAAWR